MKIRRDKSSLVLELKNKTIVVCFDDKEGVLVNTYLREEVVRKKIESLPYCEKCGFLPAACICEQED